MKIKTVIFDLDGTLLDTIGDLAAAVNFGLRSHGYPERTVDEVRRFVGNGVRNLILRSLNGVETDDFNEVFADFKKYYSEHNAVLTVPYPGITELLRVLKEKGIGTAIVSNKYDAAVKALNVHYFGDLIPVAIGEKEGVSRKPAPDSVLLAMKELNADPASTVYVGDSEVDVETAKNASLPCLTVTWGFRDREILRSAGAESFFDTADELKNAILSE